MDRDAKGSSECVFCERIAKDEYESEVAYGVVCFEPLNRLIPGHMLFIPRKHVVDAAHDAAVAGRVFEAAALWGARFSPAFNLITSAGRDATQTVFHLHVHYVPRRHGDNLHLPWTGQRK